MSDREQAMQAKTGPPIRHKDLAFLAEASALLGASLDYAATLRQVADLAVPRLADRCSVYVIEADGVLRPVAVAHRDPVKREAFWAWLRRFPPDPTGQGGVAYVARTGRALLYPTLTEEVLREFVRSEEELAAARQLAPRSVVIVPLLARERSLGVLSLAIAQSRRPYGPYDLALAEELGRRAGQAVDHALLYRQAQEAMAAKDEALAAKDEALALLDTLFSAASVGFGFFDRDLRFVRLNQALAALNGVPLEQHLGRTVREVLPAVADTAEPVLRRVIETGELLVNWELKGETPAAPGVERHWLEGLYPVRTAGGQVIGVGVVATEITDLKRLEAERETALAHERAARAEAEAGIRALNQFLSFAGHDLQNPLTSIKLTAQLLRRRLEAAGTLNPREAGQKLMQVDRAATRMGMLIDELMDVARLRMGQPLALNRRVLDLADLVLRVVAEQQQTTQRHWIRVQVPAGSVAGRWDERRLERLIANLLANAIKYSPDGGEIAVTVGIEEGPAPEAWVRVRDSGIGIAAGDLPRIFAPFYRGSNAASRFPGAGLGLAGALAIAVKHGGTLSVDSQEGTGAVFTLRLPLDGGSTPPSG